MPSNVAVTWYHWPDVRACATLTQRSPFTGSLKWKPKAQLVGEPYLSCQLQVEDPDAAFTLLATPLLDPAPGEHVS